MASLADILSSVQSHDPQSRSHADTALQAMKQANPPAFIAQLAEVLSLDSAAPVARQLAGLSLKNLLKNTTQEECLVDLWAHVSPETKQQVRNSTLGTLACQNKDIRNSAAQAVATLIGLDLPQGAWGEVIGVLVTNASNVNADFKEASVMTLGYICEELPKTLMTQEQVNHILTPIVGCLAATEDNLTLKVVALRALRNSLKFIEQNMRNPTEREYLVKVACECCRHSDEAIRFESLQVLCDFAFFYYELIGPELNLLGATSFYCINNDSMTNAILGMEFWTIIADQEKGLLEARETPKGYIQLAHDTLLLIALNKIEDRAGTQEDEWSLHKASATIIGSVASVIGNPILGKVSNYIASNLNSTEPVKRECATLVFGMILEGCSSDAVSQMVTSGMNSLYGLLQDHKESVRHTAAWTLSKICEFHCSVVCSPTIFRQLLASLLAVLGSHPKIACHSCWALINILENEETPRITTAEIEEILNKLLVTGVRTDAADPAHHLQIAAFTALATVIEKAPVECVPLIEQKTQSFVELLKGTTQQANPEVIQGLLCAILQNCFGRAHTGSISSETAHEFMTVILGIFAQRRTVVEEGVQAIGTLAGNMEGKFEMYLENFLPYLTWSLENLEAMSIVKSGTMCVGDLARALGERLSFSLDKLVGLLLTNLTHDKVVSDVKVQSIESLGDLASSCKRQFVEQIARVLPIIESAANMSVQVVNDKDDIDLYEYLQELREAILVFYVGLLQGLSDAKRADMLLGAVPKIVEYTLCIVNGQYNPNVGVHLTAIGLLGDIANLYKTGIKDCLSNPSIMSYLQVYMGSDNKDLQELAKYSITQINEINR